MEGLRQRLEEVGLAFGLLTRLPMPAFDVRTAASLASSFWVFPIAGAFIGLAGATIFAAVRAAGLSDQIGAILGLCTMVVLTGALHEDGFADFWDGVGGGKTLERRLEIMRDSRIGTFGVVALVAAFLTAVELMAMHARHWPGLGVIVAAGAVSRVAIVLPLCLLPAARSDGLAQYFGVPSFAVQLAGVLIAAGLTGLACTLTMAIGLFAGAAFGAAIITGLASRFLGGYTGDVLGTVIVAAFLGALGAGAMMSSPL